MANSVRESLDQNTRSAGCFSPFNLKCDVMERLLLINFEKDPDSVYIGFEPQVFDNPVKGRGLLVIAWRLDGRIDVYHQPGLTLTREDYDIVGKGLCDFVVASFDGGHFDIGERGVDLALDFTDKAGRPVSLRIHERHPRRRKPFGLLAPFPSGTENPPALTLALLHDFYFVRRAQTEISVTIDGRQHQLDLLPAPIDGTRMYFVRYSPDAFIVLWNETRDGPLTPLRVDGDRAVDADGVVYEISERDGQPEISAFEAHSDRHQVRFAFDPPFPNVIDLRDGARIAGTFSIDLEKAIGQITGHYQVQRRADCVEISISPTGGWRPRISKLSLWIMFTAAKVFKSWPKAYQWHARMDVSQPAAPVIRSRWQRSG
jgi:hypothetical protein